MGTKRLVFGDGSPLVLKLRAGYADVTLKAVKGATEASVVLTGDQAVLDEVTENREAGNWSIRIPNQGAGGGIQVNSFSSDGSVTATINAGGSSSVIQSAGDMNFSGVQIGGVTFGRTRSVRGYRGSVSIGNMQAGGRVTVDGVDVTDYVREQRGGKAPEDDGLTAEIILPEGSLAGLDVAEGRVGLSGMLEAQVETRNAPVTATGMITSGMIKSRNGDIWVEAAMDITLETRNGDIDLDSAQGHTMVSTHNGNSRVHAAADIAVMASSHNGDVEVTKAPGTSPRVMASTHNGRVRRP